MTGTTWSRLVRLGTAGFLLLALARLPYGYYQLLRLIVCAVSTYTAYLAYTLPNRQAWTWGFGAIALLFNPVAPVHLSKAMWVPLDVATAVAFLASVLFLPPWTFLKLWWRAFLAMEEGRFNVNQREKGEKRNREIMGSAFRRMPWWCLAAYAPLATLSISEWLPLWITLLSGAASAFYALYTWQILVRTECPWADTAIISYGCAMGLVTVGCFWAGNAIGI